MQQLTQQLTKSDNLVNKDITQLSTQEKNTNKNN
jgi:hypothetical protein